MINTRNTTLNKRPKALDAVGVNIPVHIYLGMVVNPLVLVTEPSHVVITREFIGIKSGIRGYLAS